jgi:hypothetical protein
MIVCAAAPPSDHAANVPWIPVAETAAGADTLCCDPTAQLNVCGAA